MPFVINAEPWQEVTQLRLIVPRLVRQYLSIHSLRQVVKPAVRWRLMPRAAANQETLQQRTRSQHVLQAAETALIISLLLRDRHCTTDVHLRRIQGFALRNRCRLSFG